MILSDNVESGATNSDVGTLNDLWRTEVNSPELLHFQTKLIADLQETLSVQQNLIDEKVAEARSEEHFTVTIYQMEIERIRYSLARYLRTRLIKIEKNLEHILKEYENRLSEDEKTYAYKLQRLNDSFFAENVTARFEDQGLAQFYARSEDRKINSIPKLSEFVFCKAVRDIHNVQVAVGQQQDIKEGEINILQYSVIQREVLQGSMQLL